MGEYVEPDLTPADQRRLRGFLAPEPTTVPVHPRTVLRCQVEADLRLQGQRLLTTAPWLLTARLVTRPAPPYPVPVDRGYPERRDPLVPIPEPTTVPVHVVSSDGKIDRHYDMPLTPEGEFYGDADDG